MKPFDMLWAAETVVTGDQVEFNRIGGIAGEELLDELTAPARQNHCILETVEDRRLHQPESVEAGLPIASLSSTHFHESGQSLCNGSSSQGIQPAVCQSCCRSGSIDLARRPIILNAGR